MIRKRKIQWIGILVLVLVMIGLSPASAVGEVTISFSNLNLLTSDDFDIYGQDGTGNWSLMGTFNTTSTGIVLDAGNYNFVLKPKSTDVIDNPMNMLEGTADFVRTNLVALLIGAFVVGMVIWKR